MFENFDEAAEQAIVQTQEEARQRGHAWLGPEHLLLALLRFPNTAVRPMLRALGVAPGDVAARIDAAIVSGPPGEVEQRRFDLNGRAVLVASEEQATALGQPEVRSEHLLLALAVRDKGVAGTVLRSLGVTPDRLRELLRATPEITVRTVAGSGGFSSADGSVPPPPPRPGELAAQADPGLPTGAPKTEDEAALRRHAETSPYTWAVLRAFTTATIEAKRRGHAELEPLHLLVGLIAEANQPGGAGPLFVALGVPVDLAARVDAALASRPTVDVTDLPNPSPASRDTMARAVRAKQVATPPGVDPGKVGPGDLLIGLVDKRTGACAKILAEAGVTEASLRALDVPGAPPALARAPGATRNPFGRR